MEALCDLLFELSNEDRLRILQELEQGDLRLSHVARKLDFTVQETTRNVARLVNAKLVVRTPSGVYEVTSYGHHAIRLLDGYKFISKHSDYFVDHSLFELPYKFQLRIGELNECKPVKRLMDTFGIIEKILREVEDYYLYITNETLSTASGYQLSLTAHNSGVQGKGIKPTGFTRSRILSDNVPEEVWEKLDSFKAKGSLENKYLERIDFALFMSEKEVLFDFPDKDGNFDYVGFTSTDEKAVEWCKDVFNYYWERAGLVNDV
jgi:predicted transcriptional regulator